MAVTISGDTGISAVQAGAVESGDLPAGSVIQVKHVLSRNSVNTTASSPVGIGLSVSITPRNSDSTFILFCKVQAEHEVEASGYGLIWFRDGSEVRTPNAYYEVFNGNLLNQDGERTAAHFQYLDSPSTTSTITYEVKVEVYNGNLMRFNDNGDFESNLTVMEIAG